VNRLLCFLMQHKNALHVLRVAIVVAAVAVATVTSVGIQAGPFGDDP